MEVVGEKKHKVINQAKVGSGLPGGNDDFVGAGVGVEQKKAGFGDRDTRPERAPQELQDLCFP